MILSTRSLFLLLGTALYTVSPHRTHTNTALKAFRHLAGSLGVIPMMRF